MALAAPYAGVPLHVWKGAFLSAVDTLPDGLPAKLPYCDVRVFCESQSADPVNFARKVAVMLKYWGCYSRELAGTLLATLDDIMCGNVQRGDYNDLLEEIMLSDGDQLLPGIVQPTCAAWASQLPGNVGSADLACYLSVLYWGAARAYSERMWHVRLSSINLSGQLVALFYAPAPQTLTPLKDISEARSEMGEIKRLANSINKLAEEGSVDEAELAAHVEQLNGVLRKRKRS